MKERKYICNKKIEKSWLINSNDYKVNDFNLNENAVICNTKLLTIIKMFRDTQTDRIDIISLVNHLQFNILRSFKELTIAKNKLDKFISVNLLKRSPEQILDDGYFIGCTDLAIVVANALRLAGYYCELIFTVSQNFSLTNNRGHTFIFATIKGQACLIDASLKSLYENYSFESEYLINSLEGNQLIIGRTQNLKQIGLTNKTELTKLRNYYFFNHKNFKYGFISKY